MTVLVTGGKGLLAHAIRELSSPGLRLVFWDIEEFDLTRADVLEARLEELRPAWVVNTAAYNLVDRCEQERELSWAVNALGPETLARLCVHFGCRLIHFSSDYVFDGAKGSPYVEADATNPLNHYGKGKLHGEQAVLRASPENIVFRTSWMFGLHPFQAKSYVHSVLAQARAGKRIMAVTDQAAAPTYAPDLARCVTELLARGASGLFHAVNSEGLSRYEWTLEILELARKAGVLQGRVEVEPVLTSFFGSTMRRPPSTVLCNQKVNAALKEPLPSWKVGLAEMLRRM